MKRTLFLLLSVFSIFFYLTSCTKHDDRKKYDVILVIGQSNTHSGIGYDEQLDKTQRKIKQLGRFGDNDYQIILAREPLDHFHKYENHIGFALSFAKKYLDIYLQPSREILIIPGGKGSTGFITNHWNPGDTLYEDAVKRTNYVLTTYPNSKLIAILWHQGEADVHNCNYQQNLDTMITNLRKDIISADESTPFILGGMVPYWVEQDSLRQKTNKIISETPTRIINTGYADPTIPYIIYKSDNDSIPIHYDAAGLREMGERYFEEYQWLIINYTSGD
jgi:hypothetical protein